MRRVVLLCALATVAVATAASAQTPAQIPATPLPPVTKLEAFVPTAGTLVTIGYDPLGAVGIFRQVTVELREARTANQPVARGLVVTVVGASRSQSSIVDADELPELLKGIDAILAITDNATGFEGFQTEYKTRGALGITVYKIAQSVTIQYQIAAGRILGVPASSLTTTDIRRFRAMVAAASVKLATLEK